MPGGKVEVDLGKNRVAGHLGWIFARQRIQLCSRGEDLVLVQAVVVGRLRNHTAGAVAELHDRRHRQLMLIVPEIYEGAILVEGTAQSSAELPLPLVGLAADVGRLGVEVAVANIEKAGSMPVVAARVGDHVEHRSSGASQLGAVTIGRDAKLLDDLVAELIGRAIASAGLSEKAIVVVGAVDQKAVLVAASSAVGEITVRAGGLPSRV